MNKYQFQFNVVEKYFPALLSGMCTTVKITLISIFFGLILGMIIAILRLSKNKIISGIASGYIELFRCTPVLVQIVWIFYCFPIVFNVTMSGVVSGVVALTLNVSAFYSEAFRSGIQAIKKDQYDAAEALGFNKFQSLIYIILPQAIMIIVPVVLSNSVSLFKESSLVSTVAIADLMYQGRLISMKTYRPIEILTIVAIMYFCVAFPLTLLVRKIEEKISYKINR